MDQQRRDPRIFITLPEAAVLSPGEVGREVSRLLEEIVVTIFGGRSS